MDLYSQNQTNDTTRLSCAAIPDQWEGMMLMKLQQRNVTETSCPECLQSPTLQEIFSGHTSELKAQLQHGTRAQFFLHVSQVA